MSDFALDDLDRARLDWPEPVLIDVIKDCYRVAPDAADTGAAARLHVRFLRELVEGGPREAAFLRLEMIAACAARGICFAAIEAADYAAFRELANIVEGRFRNSPRLRIHFTQSLCEALRRLPERAEPPRQTANVRVLAAARSNAGRVPHRVGQRLAVNG